MTTTNEPDFDWSQAASLLGDDPAQVEPDMAAIILELIQSSEARFKELKAKNAETERPVICSLAHQLRGSLLNFGFTAVGAILWDIEKREYPASEYPALIEKAHATFDVSKKMFGARYHSLGIS
ncbi:MAG TPA: Hpt domain-containing protein [Candidatus Methylacidiphilales bacterium]|nr:Hpt domain-containing protein [Candidatus Methylacidiphilales bacterium]